MGRKKKLATVPGSRSCLKTLPSYSESGLFERKVKKAERWLKKNKSKIIARAGTYTVQAIVMTALPEVAAILNVSSIDPVAKQFIINLIRKTLNI